MDIKDVADFIYTVSFDKLPPDVVAQTKLCTLDTLGAAIAGRNTRTVGVVERLVRSMGGKKEATLIGCGVKAPLDRATLVNSTMATVLDSDDGCMSPIGHLGHIGGCVIPAALAVAEGENSTGRAFIEAVVAGYEVYLRTSQMLTKAEGKPFRAGTLGTYGAAAAAGKLLRLDRKELVNTIGIAEAHTPVPKMGRISNTGPMTKEVMPWGAMTGVMAALLAHEGFVGPTTSYDEPGYDKAFLDSLGKSYEMMKIYFKPYCACRYTHTALDVLLELVRKHSLSPDVSVTVEVGTRQSLLNTKRPISIEHAEYSFPFLIGVALLEGKVSPKQMREDQLGDETVLKQADKVKIVFNKTIDDLFPARFGAIVTIKTKDGKKYEGRRDFARGDLEDPLSNKELEEKFREWVATVIDSERAEGVLSSIRNLDNLDSINELVQLLGFSNCGRTNAGQIKKEGENVRDDFTT